MRSAATGSGNVLSVYFELDGQGRADNVCLETVVRFVYTGRLHPSLIERALAAPEPA